MEERKYWNPEIETLPRVEIEKLQEKRMKAQVKHAYENTAYYNRKFRELGITPEDIKTLDDFRKKVPFTIKDVVREERDKTGDPWGGFLAVPIEELVNIHTSTGTTGIPTFGTYTKSDWDHIGEVVARWMWTAGLRKNEILMNFMVYYHMYNTWLDAGAEKIGAIQFKRGGFPFEVEADVRQVKLWSYANPHVIHMLTQGLKIATAYIKENNIDIRKMLPRLKSIIFAGDILTSHTRKEMMDIWGVPLYDAGGPTETYCALIGYCEENVIENWQHMADDLCISEVIDPERLENIAPGERGEIVYTNLFPRRATPYLRWRSEDAVDFEGFECSCGRSFIKARLLGRVAHEIRVKDKKVYQRDVEEVLQRYPETRYVQYQTIREKPQPQDKLILRILKELPKEFEEKIIGDFKSQGIETVIEPLTPEEIKAAGGWKFLRIVDRKKA